MSSIRTEEDPESATLLAALCSLPPAALSSLSAALAHRQQRITAVVSSPAVFSSTLDRLHGLSLPQKSLLIARYFLATLRLLAPFLEPPPLPGTLNIKLRDLDTALLLLLFCEINHHHPQALRPTSHHQWPRLLSAYHFRNVFTLSGVIKVSPSGVVRSLVDVVAMCRRFVGSADGCGGGPEGREVAASVAAVVALPSVQVRGEECVICKEEMREGRDVCQLPCQHRFHWMCVLQWLRARNTCPCCRHRLPTDDVFGEIQRLWEAVVKASHA